MINISNKSYRCRRTDYWTDDKWCTLVISTISKKSALFNSVFTSSDALGDMAYINVAV